MKTWQRRIRELLDEAAAATTEARDVASSESDIRDDLETLIEMIEQIPIPDSTA